MPDPAHTVATAKKETTMTGTVHRGPFQPQHDEESQGVVRRMRAIEAEFSAQGLTTHLTDARAGLDLSAVLSPSGKREAEIWVDEDGYVEVRDRFKDVIISGGENISSIEVEDALYKHSAVQAAAVVAKPDDKWGETPCAFVELKPGQSATADELVAWCKQNLAGYKVPRHIVFAELPKTSTGKIQKFKLRDMAKVV